MRARRAITALVVASMTIVACTGTGSGGGSNSGGGFPVPGPGSTDPPVIETAPPSTLSEADKFKLLVLDPIALESFVLVPFTTDLDTYWTSITVGENLGTSITNWKFAQVDDRFQAACSDETGNPAVLTAADGAFYCSSDNTVYASAVQLSLYMKGLDRLPEATSEIVAKSILAHEKGHALEHQFGWWDNWIQSNPVDVKPAELAADCLAGKALVGISQSTVLNNTGVTMTNEDFVDLVYDSIAAGDFQMDNPGHHGTPRERANALLDGLTAESGDYAPCMAYMGLKPATNG